MKVTQNKLTHLRSLLLSYDTLCAIWYQLYNLENVEKKPNGGVLLLVKLQVSV